MWVMLTWDWVGCLALGAVGGSIENLVGLVDKNRAN